MPPKPKKPTLLSRFGSLLKGRSSNSAFERSTLTDPIPNTGSGSLRPHDSLKHSHQQDSISQLSKQPSAKERNPVGSSRSTANATHLAVSTSTPTALDPTAQSLIHPAASSSKDTALCNPQDRLPASHSPPAPPPAGPPSISLFESAYDVRTGDFNINANQVNVFNEAGSQQNTLEIQRRQLATLPKHPHMSAKRVEYLPDSRKPDVEKLCERESSSTDLVLCIHGPAGIGKSTLAGHLSDEFRSAGRLAASIFLGAIRTEILEPETIVKMIAYEIGNIHPRAISKIVEAMDQCHATSLENHLQKYILEPLLSLGHAQPLIIIMDAMDEWRDHPTFIKALGSLNSASSILKFITTDRLNPCATHLPGIERISIYTYLLGPISKEVIRVYFVKHLETVPWVDGRKAHSADVEKLTELSGGLPVWASTVIALLSHSFSEFPPHEILADIVGSRWQVGGSEGLRELYRNGLRRLFPTPDAQKYFRRHFGAAMALQEPLSLADFSALTGIPSHLVNKIRFALSALQTRSPPPGSGKMIHPAATLCHLSFLEYLQASTTETSFAISTFDSHSAIGLACLKQVAILPPSSPHSNFPLRALQHYAVKYWLHHVFNGTPRSNDKWSQTEHCSTLQMMPDTHRQWAALFLKNLMPREVDSVLEDVGEDSMVSTLRKLAHWLGKTGDHWGFQVACLEVAVRIDGGDAEGWSDLGWCYGASGDRTGNLQMHEEAVVAFRQAVHLRPDPHPSRGESLDGLAIQLRSCYRYNGDSNVLSEAISCSRMGLTLSPTPHPDRDRHLNTLANTLGDFYRRNGDLKTLNEVISLFREALALRPAPHPHHCLSLNNLAIALDDLYQGNGDINALNEAISLHRNALTLRPAPHPYRHWSLSNLANALYYLHRNNSDIDVLNEAILLNREALGLRPAPHPDRSSSLNNLATALDDLHRCNGDINTLNEAISLHREALGLRPAPHPDRSSSLNNLANSLHALYQYNKDIGTLNESISLGCEALALRPAPHPLRDTTLRVLADAYLSQFEQNGAVEVLDGAVLLRREVLVYRPPGHRYRTGNVESLVRLLETRRRATGDDRDCGEINDLAAELAARRMD